MSVIGRAGRGLLGGYVVLLVVFLYAPLVVLTLFAFNDSTVLAFPIEHLTTKWFHAGLTDGDLIAALGRSAGIAAINGLASTLLGVMAAIGLAGRRLPLRRTVLTLILLPLVVPYIVLAVGLVVLLHEFGIATSLLAVLAGHVVISLPYSVLVILPRLRTLDDSILEAARDLGASELKAFALVTLPLLAPALLSSFLIAFTVSFDEFAIASFLAPPGSPTYPVFLYAGARTPALLPEVVAIGSIVIALSLLVVVLAEVGRRWVERRLEAVPEEGLPLAGAPTAAAAPA
jgi:spermidine/putrescine transport system permease protein